MRPEEERRVRPREPSLRAYHDSHDERYREPFGARPCDEPGDPAAHGRESRVPLKGVRPFASSRNEQGDQAAYPMQMIRYKDLSLKRKRGRGKHPAFGTIFERTLELPRGARPHLVLFQARGTRHDVLLPQQPSQARRGVGMLCPLSRPRCVAGA
jgi:hypothetical protein